MNFQIGIGTAVFIFWVVAFLMVLILPAKAATIEVYVLEYQGQTISLATDMAEFECIELKDEIQDLDTDDLSCVKLEVRRELI